MDVEPWIGSALALLGGYSLGSIPFGLLLARGFGAGDLRTIGSGNIGATNVLRTGRKDLAVATLLLDAVKGAVAVLLARWLLPEDELLAAIGAFYGHIFPVWLRFHGGKGVATYLGIALALSWPCGLGYAAAWLVCALASRHSSVGGMAAGWTTPVIAAALLRAELALLFLAFALTVLWTHRANLARLMSGTEPRMGRGGPVDG